MKYNKEEKAMWLRLEGERSLIYYFHPSTIPSNLSKSDLNNLSWVIFTHFLMLFFCTSTEQADV